MRINITMKPYFFILLRSYTLALFFTFSCIITSSTFAISKEVQADDKMFRPFKLENNKLTIKEYVINNTKQIDLSSLEIFPNQSNDNFPFNYTYFSEPDWILIYLNNGYAKLKNEYVASESYKNAQEKAKNKRVGMWSQILAKDNSPDIVPKQEPQPPQTHFDFSSAWKKLINITMQCGGYIKYFIAEWGGYAAAIGSLFALWKIFRIYRNRRKLILLFLGARSTGKTTLFKRMFFPADRPSECDEPTTSPKTITQIDLHKVNWGGFEVTPIYVDTAGGKPGEQTTEMLNKDRLLNRLFRPSRHVWIIVLATTDKQVSQDDTEESKIDHDFITEQLGYLYLPRGILQATNTPKPDMIVICLSKFDLLSEYEPHSKFAVEAKIKINGIFNNHIERIKETAGEKIPVHIEAISACEGWRVREIRDAIEKQLYSGGSN